MSSQANKRGSIWRRWDLHLHAPGTKLSDAFGGSSPENIEQYLRELEGSEVMAFGIADYFSFDSYFTVVSAYERLYRDGEKFFIPNLELRLTETVSSTGANVHAHVLIDPLIVTKEKLQAVLSDLKTHISREGVKLSCEELTGRADFEKATVSIVDVVRALSGRFADPATYLILMAGNKNGLRGVDTKSPRSLSISDELDKASDAFFGIANNTAYFLREDRYEGSEKAEKKPVFSGSDAHSFAELARLSGDEAGYPGTWIKADLTFRGL